MSSVYYYCECRCNGGNHGLALRWFGALFSAQIDRASRAEILTSIRPVSLGTKTCLCGCGLETLRRFFPGHDARYHAIIKREKQAAERGVSLEELPAMLKVEQAERAKARRAAAKTG